MSSVLYDVYILRSFSVFVMGKPHSLACFPIHVSVARPLLQTEILHYVTMKNIQTYSRLAHIFASEKQVCGRFSINILL